MTTCLGWAAVTQLCSFYCFTEQDTVSDSKHGDIMLCKEIGI